MARLTRLEPMFPLVEVASTEEDWAAVPADADTPMSLIYTSGTTGASKGAVLTQGNFATNALALVTGWGITAADRFLCALPLFHVHGLGNGVCSWLASGCRMRLIERFEAAKVATWFEEFRPTLFFGVPTVYVRLLDLPAETARAMGLEVGATGTHPTSPWTEQRIIDTPHYRIVEGTLRYISAPAIAATVAQTTLTNGFIIWVYR